MKKSLFIIGTLFLLSACVKGKSSCTGYTANGEEMFEVVGSDDCQNQISEADGEYCICYE
ncbi:MAG: lipoprotein [Flavobacteriales bacterium]|nr:lipoprotein [Flavobacteriales bacterium]